MGVVKNEINISRLMARMAGIEANTAGIMTSVAAIEATTAGIMTSVSRLSLKVTALDADHNKNLLSLEHITPVESGVKFVKNADGSISVSGTTTALSTVTVEITGIIEDTETEYVLTGSPASGGSSSYQMDITTSGGYPSISGSDTGSGLSFRFPQLPESGQHVYARIRIASSYTTPGTLVFYPMIRKSGTPDNFMKHISTT